MNEERLIKIETLLVHQERQIQDLSEMLHLQSREIAVLIRRLDHTTTKISALEDGSDGKSLSATEQAMRDKPPHY